MSPQVTILDGLHYLTTLQQRKGHLYIERQYFHLQLNNKYHHLLYGSLSLFHLGYCGKSNCFRTYPYYVTARPYLPVHLKVRQEHHGVIDKHLLTTKFAVPSPLKFPPNLSWKVLFPEEDRRC